MKKLLSSVSISALAFCFILQSAHAMKREREAEEEKRKGIVTIQSGPKTENKFPGFEPLPQELKAIIIWTSCHDFEFLQCLARVSKFYYDHINRQMLGRSALVATMTNEDIKKCELLVRLDLCENITIKDDGINGLTNLISLSLPPITKDTQRFTDEGIKFLTNLKHLYLNGSLKDDDEENVTPPLITNKGLTTLISLTHLELPYFYTRAEWDLINDEGIKLLTNVVVLGLDYNDCISDAGIQGLTNLTSLNLRGNEIITNDGIRRLINLTYLDIIDNNKISDEGIRGLTNLRSLRVDPGTIRPITWSGLKNLKNLTDSKSIREECALQFRKECRAHAEDSYRLSTEASNLLIKQKYLFEAINKIFTICMDLPDHRTEKDLQDYQLFRRALDGSLKSMDDAILGSK